VQGALRKLQDMGFEVLESDVAGLLETYNGDVGRVVEHLLNGV
jgi:hypothetical protein